MHAPAPKSEKAPRRAPKTRASEESTVSYLSGYVSKSGVQDPDARKIDQLEKLLCQTRELVCMLLAVRYGATRRAPCEHTVVKRYPPGMRDNGEYDLVCTRCGKNF